MIGILIVNVVSWIFEFLHELFSSIKFTFKPNLWESVLFFKEKWSEESIVHYLFKLATLFLENFKLNTELP